jgi:hypothetical protein
MRIPKWIKQLANVCDRESSRYALGGILVEHKDGVGSLTATDGRILCNVSYPDNVGPDMDMVINGKEAGKAVTHCITKDKVLSVGPDERNPDKYATICGQKGASSVEVMEGRFPRYEDIFDMNKSTAGYVHVRLCPHLLGKLMEVYAAAVDANGFDRKAVGFWIKDSRSAVHLAHTTSNGEVIRSLIMPIDPTADNAGTTECFPCKAQPDRTTANLEVKLAEARKPQKQHTAVAAPSVDMSALDAIEVAPLT